MKLDDLRGRRVVVWGYGAEGRAAVALLRRHGDPAELRVVVDQGPLPVVDPALDVPVGLVEDTDLRGVDVIVKSPGVSPYHGPLAEAAARLGIEVTGGTALWFAATGGDRTVAVTGSKGKSTTSTLVAELLRATGRPTVLAGNVGRALLDVLLDRLDHPAAAHAADADEWFVVETSSFQAAEVRHSPQVGVLTALFPEHLDWHGSVDRYFDDKCNLFAHRDGIRVAANTDNAAVAARFASLPGAVAYGGADGLHVRGTLVCRPDGSPVLDTATSRLPGRHNAVNLAGALTAVELAGVDLRAGGAALQAAVDAFSPLQHRLEPVGERAGRLVVDDSLSTAPEAAVAALAAFADRPVGIIVGGHDRGLDYTSLARAFAARTAPTIVCGVPASGERIVALVAQAVQDMSADPSLVTLRCFDDFDDAVHHLDATVPVGGVIVLSPAAPSFGRFANYAERGWHFRALLGLGGAAAGDARAQGDGSPSGFSRRRISPKNER